MFANDPHFMIDLKCNMDKAPLHLLRSCIRYYFLIYYVEVGSATLGTIPYHERDKMVQFPRPLHYPSHRSIWLVDSGDS